MSNGSARHSLIAKTRMNRKIAYRKIACRKVVHGEIVHGRLAHGKIACVASMSLFVLLLFAFICGPVTAPTAYAQSSRRPASDSGKPSGDVARGKYLVESVAMCGQCHTPRDSNGNVDRSHWLQGAPMRWVPAEGSASNWPLTAPRIGGSPPASDSDLVKLLTTGIWTTGKPLRFPMMPFRMTEADAKAVVAYLRSLPPQN